MNLNTEAEFFKDIHKQVIDLVKNFSNRPSVVTHKDILGDFATEVDVAVEKLVVAEIQKRFSGDEILAEEEHNDTELSDKRIWIIDPICGTTNVSRDIKYYCTNIALSQDGKLVASCVIDHSQGDLLWSIGENKVYKNDSLVEKVSTEKRFGVLVDVDLGASNKLNPEVKQKICDATFKILSEDGYMPMSGSSSLSFVYTAIGKVDGFINVSCHPWDMCAAAFLTQQSGGTITALDGRPWEISSVGAIAAVNPQIHQKLVQAYNGNS